MKTFTLSEITQILGTPEKEDIVSIRHDPILLENYNRAIKVRNAFRKMVLEKLNKLL